MIGTSSDDKSIQLSAEVCRRPFPPEIAWAFRLLASRSNKPGKVVGSPGQECFLTLNAELSRQWSVIDARKDPPPDADEWARVEEKLKYLER